MNVKQSLIALAMVFGAIAFLSSADQEHTSIQLVIGLALIVAACIYTAVKTKTFSKEQK